ncbi:hypothetical protein ASJ81_19690 [Methanosarcina spelaei]|uniref:Uncharacterized protein n=1 Tax=Methanosarcina spelaei TaxID=1036679 RepID=A0A2A2HTP4_9EURY|nr:hypothetical protein [Methanosarcina spelaei]PAV12762.1 hypothetical protein ASJ81_19690 [Methanosarcina spelaei]
MRVECCIERQQHNLMIDEEEVEKVKAELEIASEKVAYFDSLIITADSLRKSAESKIILTQSKKLDTISNKLDSQIQSLGELIRKAETKREEAISKLLDAEVSLIVLENKILHSKLARF